MALNIPQGTKLVYVSFSANIDIGTAEQLINTMAALANLQVQKVHLLLSTRGGDIAPGMNLYNVLSGMPFELTTHNVGSVSSIGIIVLLAGSKRYATDNATFMFHEVGNTVSERLVEKNLLEHLDSFRKDQNRIGNIIVQNTNITQKDVLSLFKGAQIKDVQFALEKGIINEVRAVDIPKGIPVVAVTFKR